MSLRFNIRDPHKRLSISKEASKTCKVILYTFEYPCLNHIRSSFVWVAIHLYGLHCDLTSYFCSSVIKFNVVIMYVFTQVKEGKSTDADMSLIRDKVYGFLAMLRSARAKKWVGCVMCQTGYTHFWDYRDVFFRLIVATM